MRVWRVGAGDELLRWKPHHSPVRRLAFSPDGAELVGYVDDPADPNASDLLVLRLDVLRRQLADMGLGW